MKYKIGDKVVFYRKPKDDELFEKYKNDFCIKGYDLYWFNEINKNVGKEGTIVRIFKDDEQGHYKYNVNFKNGVFQYTYPEFLLIDKKDYRIFKMKRLISEENKKQMKEI